MHPHRTQACIRPVPILLAAGEEVLGQDAYNDLDINRLDLSSAGLGGG